MQHHCPAPIPTSRIPAVALALALALPALAQTTPQPAASSPAAQASRFATDAAVREGMQGIRELMAAQESRIATRALNADDYRALARAIDAQMRGPLAQRSLPKAASIAFRGSIWQDLEYCVGLMRDGRSVSMQRTGAFGVQQVLRNYPVYFDHPGW